MFLLHCPRCRGCTPADDDATKVACQWCHVWVEAADTSTLRGPDVLRQHVLDDLRPITSLMLTFGIGQTLTAAIYFWFFINVMSNDMYWHLGEHNPMVYAIGVVLLIGGVFIIAGSVALRRGRGRLYAVVGAIFTLTSPLLIGLPIGVWALQRLSRPEVRAAFAPSAGRSES